MTDINQAHICAHCRWWGAGDGATPWALCRIEPAIDVVTNTMRVFTKTAAEFGCNRWAAKPPKAYTVVEMQDILTRHWPLSWSRLSSLKNGGTHDYHPAAPGADRAGVYHLVREDMTDDINDYIKRLEDDVERTHRALVEQEAKIASLSYAMLGLLAERDLHRKEGAEEPHDVH